MSNWKLLGEFIEPYDERNGNNITNVLGLNKNKEFMPTVANMDGVELSKYKVNTEGSFVFSGMQTGRDICIRLGMYLNSEPAVVSPAYTTFRVKKDSGVIPEYLFMYFYRQEMDRFGWFLSDSSIRANLDWERFTSIAIPVPDIKVQRSVVAAWQGLREMQAQNERLAATLMPLCRSYLQDLKHKYKAVEIGDLIKQRDERNRDNKYGEESARGVNTQKEIQPCKRLGEKLDTYKIAYQNDFVFNANIKLTKETEKFAIALYTDEAPIIVTNFYTVFYIDDQKRLLPEFLLLILSRDEFARYVKFMSCSSIRDRFDFHEMQMVKIPLPPIEVQQAIVSIFQSAQTAKQLAGKANYMSRNICPALIQKAIHS